MSLKYRQLQAFHAIVETGTVTGAAAQLGISQPGISNLLAQLERETRLRLFRRDRGRLVPTPEAGVLYQEIDTVVRGLDHVAQTVTDLQNQRIGQLQVASTHALSLGFLPREIARFTATRPDLTISFQAQYSGKIQEWVAAGLFEIGICELPIDYDAFGHQLLQFDMLCALPETSALTRHDVLTPALLEDAPFIVMGPDHMTHRRTRELFQGHGANWRIRVHTHLFANMLSFVKQGMGVSLIDPFTLAFDSDGGYVTRPFQPAVRLDMAIITAKSRVLSQPGQEFLDQLRGAIARFALPAPQG